MNKEYKEDCGFRKYLRVCKFPVDKCKPPEEGEDWADSCHLYPLRWDAKWLRKKAKEETKLMLMLEKELKHLKKTDKEKYRETKNRIKDIFLGCVHMGKAIMFIKRSGKGLNKAEKRVADKILAKLGDKKESTRGQIKQE